jgi:hypothetical protein
MNMLNEYDIAGTSYKAGSDSVAETSDAMVNADVIPGKAAPTGLSLSDNSRAMTHRAQPLRRQFGRRMRRATRSSSLGSSEAFYR